MVPSNNILNNQYTRGGEFYYKSTGNLYQGYYCVVQDNKYYTGKTYTKISKELIKIPPVNPTGSVPTSISPTKNVSGTRYFIRKVNVFPIAIKEVSKETYDQTIDPFYNKLSINGSQIYSGSKLLDEAEKKMPGLKLFLNNELDFGLSYN